MGREDEIRLIAYNIWEEEGCLDGRDCEHWFRAEVIWEKQQKGKTVTESTGTDSKQAVSQNKKMTGAKKKVKKK